MKVRLKYHDLNPPPRFNDRIELVENRVLGDVFRSVKT